MNTSNTRTLGVLLAGFVALVVLGQSAQQLSHQFRATAAVTHSVVVVETAPPAPVIVEATLKQASEFVAIPKEKCGSMWVNGGNYVLVTPKTCNDVSVASITVAVSEKPCDASTQADFRSLTNTTAFKGDYGFYVGQGKTVQCLAVKQIIGKYI